MTNSIYEVVEATEHLDGYISRTDEDGRIYCIPTDPANSDYQAYLATLVSESATPQA